MAEIGDKYIVEIAEVMKSKGTYKAYGCEVNECEEELVRIKGLDALVFDVNVLSNFKKYEPTPTAGPVDYHDLPEFIYGMSSKDKQIHIGRVTWQ